MSEEPPRTTLRQPAVRLFVFDRYPETLHGLQEFFADEGFDVIGGAEEPSDAVQQILALVPDVCVLDVGIPAGGAGIEVCRRIHAAAPGIACVMLAPWHSPAIAHVAAEAGAKALIVQNIDTRELLAAIISASARQTMAPSGRAAAPS
jgi:two-component system response regulator DevR